MKWLESEKKVSLNEFFGFVGVELGVHRDAAREYLRDIQLRGRVNVGGGPDSMLLVETIP